MVPLESPWRPFEGVLKEMRQVGVLDQGRHDGLLRAVGHNRGGFLALHHVVPLRPVRAVVPAGAEPHRRDRARVVASTVVSRISVPSSLVF